MTLASRVAAALSQPADPAVTAFAARLAEEAGALTVLFYGSNLRTGSLDGVLDFYVLLPGEAERGMWPRVSYREWEHQGETLRAKIATMTLAKFHAAASGASRDTTIWARFVQPSALVWQSDERAGAAVARAVEAACITAARLAVAVGPDAGIEADFWRALFRATYKAELRVEKPGRENSILELNAAHFDGLLPDALDAAGIGYVRQADTIRPQLSKVECRETLRWWRRRRRLGKPLNIARLLRATRTFDGAGRYAAWKVQRHTGVEVEVTPWRERHPVLAAPAVLWRVWRRKKT
ncbi:hypothetical protein [Aurantiacibacter aquimixticola]|uniref:Uncharacterized protein n=1 Tax=Aurantiacibacter aquimixticola TaxID=1958945 RepID=A0A419RUN8_9SPHN|nr:hypothetical protein [Aurantiacibacter aquimixticola]RJY09507.1 hypothetical protein D6201_09185 [Aurantiacibacter aquimixticola]